MHTSLPPIHATCPTDVIFLDITILIKLGEEYKSCSSSLCSFLHPPVTPHFFGQNILLSTLFSNTFILYSSYITRDKISHPYITIDKIIVSFILIFTSFESRREDRSFWTELLQTWPEFCLFLISLWIKFWFVTVILKCLNCDTFSNDLSAIFISTFFYSVTETQTWIALELILTQPLYLQSSWLLPALVIRQAFRL
jgi:hypothetical protein